MVFIPNGPRVGDKVRLTRDIEVLSGTFTRGSIMTITDLGDYRGPSMVDEDGNNLYEVFNGGYEKI